MNRYRDRGRWPHRLDPGVARGGGVSWVPWSSWRVRHTWLLLSRVPSSPPPSDPRLTTCPSNQHPTLHPTISLGPTLGISPRKEVPRRQILLPLGGSRGA